MATIKVLIVGVLHNQQIEKSNADSVELKLAKDGLENLLRQTIRSHQVEFIGEESKHGVETIAKRLADQHTPKIKRACIDMTDDEGQNERQGSSTHFNLARSKLTTTMTAH